MEAGLFRCGDCSKPEKWKERLIAIERDLQKTKLLQEEVKEIAEIRKFDEIN